MPINHETELYIPVKDYFESHGYEVKGEVNNCDVIAVHPNEEGFTIIELKKAFNLQLVFQAIERLKLSNSVYLAIEYNPLKKMGSYFSLKDATNLCLRLGVGLIGVQFYKRKKPAVDILCRPGLSKIKSSKRSQRIQSEFNKRSGDYNVGGSSKMKLMTAYREISLRCAALISDQESMTTRELRVQLNDNKVTRLCADNYYGWFERVSNGRYKLTQAGKQALIDYAYIIQTNKSQPSSSDPALD